MILYINTAHAILDDATDPLCLDQIAGKIHCAKPTKAQIKAVERQLKALHTAGLLESTPGRGGLPHYSLTTPTAEPAPQPRPSAAAVAVHAALDGGTDPAPGIAEQLRHAHAERLAMSNTIIAICCAIGRDPGQTTTADLPQALRDYIAAQIECEKAELTGAIADIRKAIGDDGRLMLGELAGKIKETLTALGLDSFVLDVIRNTLSAVAADLVPDCGATTTEPEAIRIMAQLIDAQQAHIQQLEEHVSELRSRIEAQILAGHNSASSANRSLTEVHEVLSTAWPEGWLQPGARTTLQLAQALKIDFGVLYGEHLDKQAAAPDAYLVTRYVRAGHGKTRAHPGGPTRHKKLDTATRKARAAIRGGYVRAEIHATNLVAVATFGAEIKPV